MVMSNAFYDELKQEKDKAEARNDLKNQILCFRMFGLLIDAHNVPTLDVLRSLEESFPSYTWLLRDIYDGVNSGQTVAQAMEQKSHEYHPALIPLLKQGEVLGNLGLMLKTATKLMETDLRLRETKIFPPRLRNEALFYQAFAAYVDSGMEVRAAFNSAQQCSSYLPKDVYSQIENKLLSFQQQEPPKSKTPLADAVGAEMCQEHFHRSERELIRVGEEHGTLDMFLNQLADYKLAAVEMKAEKS